MKKKFLIFFIFFVLSTPVSFAQELTAAVAANVQYTFEELKASFEQQTGITLQSVVGSSGQLTAQIENGAPFDIFLSADMEYPQALYKKGLTGNPPKVYAYGTLVLWTLQDIDLSEGIKILADSKIKKIAVASPQTAPYGRQAVNALKHYGLYSKVEEKLVYGESLSQVNQFIVSQAADAGLTAKSVVLAGGIQNQGRWIEIEKDSYEPIAQGAVILKNVKEKNLAAAQKFFDFIFSEPARKILQKYGYLPPSE